MSLLPVSSAQNKNNGNMNGKKCDLVNNIVISHMYINGTSLVKVVSQRN